jgi:hypothetical protein
MPGRHALKLQVAAGDGSSAGVNLDVFRLFGERPAFLPLLQKR